MSVLHLTLHLKLKMLACHVFINIKAFIDLLALFHCFNVSDCLV